MTRSKPEGWSAELSRPSGRSIFERLRQDYSSWRSVLRSLVESPAPGVTTPMIETIFLEHPYLADVATPQQLEILMTQAEPDPELLGTAEKVHGTHATLVEAHQLLTEIERRLLGATVSAQALPGAPTQTEEIPDGFLPNLERESMRVNQSATSLLHRLSNFADRLGVNDMQEYAEVAGPRPDRVSRDAGFQEPPIEEARRRR